MITEFNEIVLKIRNEKGEVVIDGADCDGVLDVEEFDDEHYELIDHIIWGDYNNFFNNNWTISLHHSYGEFDDDSDYLWCKEGEELERLSFIDESEREGYSETYWIAEHNWKKIDLLIREKTEKRFA